jgi:ketosteroid isomerase-like protein
MEEFEARLAAAYQAWHESRGRTPDRFFALYSESIELHSILEASLLEAIRGPFVGKQAAIAYFAAIAEQWEMVEAGLETIVARGDRVVCVGHATWRNLKTLRLVSGPKVDVWTVRDGLAVHYLEMFDSYGCARALGVIDWPVED